MKQLYLNVLLGLLPLAAAAQAVGPPQVAGLFAPTAPDTLTALPALLPRLNGHWQLLETGKGYWIGYTADMYAIATHGEAAIGPLLAFMQAGATTEGKIGALYCLHLIGIESTLARRAAERFRSPQARQALRSQLHDPQLQELTVKLLLRDPWRSDVPYLFEVLARCPGDNWPVVCALSRYQPRGLPIGQPVPDAVGDEWLRVPRYRYKLGSPAAENRQVAGLIQQVRALQLPTVAIEDSLGKGGFWGNTAVAFDKNSSFHHEQGLRVRTFLEAMTQANYTNCGSRLHYFVEQDCLTLCSAETARRRLIAWWETRPAHYRRQFAADAALSGPK